MIAARIHLIERYSSVSRNVMNFGTQTKLHTLDQSKLNATQYNFIRIVCISDTNEIRNHAPPSFINCSIWIFETFHTFGARCGPGMWNDCHSAHSQLICVSISLSRSILSHFLYTLLCYGSFVFVICVCVVRIFTTFSRWPFEVYEWICGACSHTCMCAEREMIGIRRLLWKGQINISGPAW